MRIIAHRTLVLFYTKHPEAKVALEEWYSKCTKANWNNFAEVKKTFRRVDSAGKQRFVFDIKGNDFRLVAMVKFQLELIYVRFVGTHSEYDNIDCKNI